MDILEGLNDQQRAAVVSQAQHLLVIAGAGSGKTRVLVSRAAWLIAQGEADPYGLMAVTFTNKAANEMKERLEEMTGLRSRWMWIGTFHALCSRLLRMEGDAFGLGRDFVIYDDADSRSVLKHVLAELHLQDEKSYQPSAVAAAISAAKNKLISSADYPAHAPADDWHENIARIYRRYQTRLKENHALDFDDLLTHTVWYLQRCPEVLARYRARFRHILVDEYQDTNHCQYRLIRLLAGEDGHIFAVGDPDQSIYRWRGADISNILDFNRDYPDCVELRLTQNYRSTQNILDAANALISHNRARKPKDLFTDAGAGEKIICYQAGSDREEAAFAVRNVMRLVDEGYSLADCAVLYRTHGQSRLLEDECIRFKIPYRVYGGMKFYERKEVKDTLAYLRVLANPHDSEALRRIYNEPRRGIGKTTWEKLEEAAAGRQGSLWSTLAAVDQLEVTAAAKGKLRALYHLLEGLRAFAAEAIAVADIIREVWERTGYAAAIAAAEDAESRLEILEQLVDTAGDFDLMYLDPALAAEAGEEAYEERPLLAFLSQVSLATDLDTAGSEQSCLSLMTLHAAKGLEFPVVFMVGMEEGVFPHKRVVFSPDESELEEERRLCYVGMTRARERLFLTACDHRQYWGKYETNKPSRFLEELPAENIIRSGSTPRRVETAPAAHGSRLTGNLFVPRAPVAAFTTEKKEPALIRVGDKLRHGKFGDGVAVAVSGSGDDMQVTVAFPAYGVKKLLWKYAPMKKI